jgi:hypothetical protein
MKDAAYLAKVALTATEAEMAADIREADFFISRSGADAHIAAVIGKILEDAGGGRDVSPGANGALRRMARAASPPISAACRSRSTTPPPIASAPAWRSTPTPSCYRS